MTPEKFLQELLASQDLSDSQERALEAHKKEVTDFLRAEFGAAPVIKYAGSLAKGTMIRDRYDLDIVCYFLSDDARTLKEIREDVAKRLSEKYLLEHKSSAERILDLKGAAAPSDFHIDVVPGRFIENAKDVFLHIQYGEKERMQTNLKTHIGYIANSECVPVIRLVKLWAHRNRIQIKTFVLELFVVEALEGSQNKGDLKASLLKVLETFKDRFEKMELVDPANSNNVVSRLMQPAEKTNIARAAANAFDSLNSSNDLSVWQQGFREDPNSTKSSNGFAATAAASSAYATGSSFKPSRPWASEHDHRE